jgi:shikimate dehydrogenase
VDRLHPRFGPTVVCAASADPAGHDLVVNCTSQGLQPGDPLPFDPARLDAGAAVVDIIMTREPTPLLQACRARGIAAHAGFEMLVQQVPEYLRFFGLPELADTLQHDLTEVRQLLYPR